MTLLSESRVRIGVIGCGAVVERVHLPRLLLREDCVVSALVDRDPARLSALSARSGVRDVFTDHRDLCAAGIDAVLVAAPNHLHAAISVDLLTAGIHVLVEKPMALTLAESDAMLEAAEASGAVLAVGMIRRFSRAGQFAKWAIDSGLLGAIRSFSLRDGVVFTWPVASDAFLRREMAGGGVLMDLGVHALDQMLWWLGDVESFEYSDDSYGGVEGDCELRVILKSGAHGIVECSRTRDLGQVALIRGDRAELEVSLIRNEVSLRFSGGAYGLSGHAINTRPLGSPEQRVRDLADAEHTDFFEAIRLRRVPAVPGREGRRSVELIERCYTSRRALRLPWVETDAGSGLEEASSVAPR